MKEFITLQLSEKDYTFRALDLDQLEQLEPQFEIINQSQGSNGLMSKEVRTAMADITCASLQYKHHDITVEACRKLITMGTFRRIMEAIAGISELVPEGAAPGNAQAGPQ
ncbi:MAG: hypothetical protein ABI433_01045 [Burkholderiaceae bacterium]